MKAFKKLYFLMILSSLSFGCNQQPKAGIEAGLAEGNASPSSPSHSVSLVNSVSNPVEAKVNTPLTSVKDLVDVNNEFAFKLYHNLESKEGNIFLSPYSISVALSMAYVGARNATREQMSKVLELPLSDEFAPLFSSLQEQLKAVAGNNDIELLIANALWVEATYPLSESFLASMKKNYDSMIFPADFKENFNKERLKINEWVEIQTKDRIKELIPSGVLNELTRLVLTNAIYFKGVWQTQFVKESTMEEAFFVSRDMSKEVSMMNSTGSFNYFEDNDMQMVELPYKGNDLSMIVVLPQVKNGIKELEKKINRESWLKNFAQMKNQKVRLFLPKFSATEQFRLKNTLANMGMSDAFTMNADFSGIDGTKDLFIAEVVHKAFIDVNEKGSEAAAATAVVMQLKSMAVNQPPVPVFRADHPFIFMIVHGHTKNILFMGRFAKP